MLEKGFFSNLLEGLNTIVCCIYSENLPGSVLRRAQDERDRARSG